MNKKQNNDYYIVKVQETPDGEPFIEFPQKLIDQLGWEVGDDVEWGETRLAFMLTLSNQSKQFRVKRWETPPVLLNTTYKTGGE